MSIYSIDDMIEVVLPENDAFLKIKETLTRIGIASEKNKTLYQSCHILHKQGKYFITHFKEMFALDGKPTNLTESDLGRRNRIVNLLEEWKLLTIKQPEKTKEPIVPLNQIKIILYKDKKDWKLSNKYSIGKKRN